MNYWIFQAKRGRYDLEAALRTDTDETWYATRYRNDMRPGDLVFFWLAGQPEVRGIYGWGRLTSEPYVNPDWEAHGVDVTYERRLDPHIPVERIQSTPALADLLILRAPQATNFLISEEEARAILELMPPEDRPTEVFDG